jgi:hypothetical protein
MRVQETLGSSPVGGGSWDAAEAQRVRAEWRLRVVYRPSLRKPSDFRVHASNLLKNAILFPDGKVSDRPTADIGNPDAKAAVVVYGPAKGL